MRMFIGEQFYSDGKWCMSLGLTKELIADIYDCIINQHNQRWNNHRLEKQQNDKGKKTKN